MFKSGKGAQNAIELGHFAGAFQAAFDASFSLCSKPVQNLLKQICNFMFSKRVSSFFVRDKSVSALIEIPLFARVLFNTIPCEGALQREQRRRLNMAKQKTSKSQKGKGMGKGKGKGC